MFICFQEKRERERDRERERERETERACASMGRAEREGDTESKQALGSELSAQRPMQGSNSRMVRS